MNGDVCCQSSNAKCAGDAGVLQRHGFASTEVGVETCGRAFLCTDWRIAARQAGRQLVLLSWIQGPIHLS